jgi:hypothetical protein
MEREWCAHTGQKSIAEIGQARRKWRHSYQQWDSPYCFTFDDSCPQWLTTNNLVLLVLHTKLWGGPKTKCHLQKFSTVVCIFVPVRRYIPSLCLAMDVSNVLLWLNYSSFQVSCHNIDTVHEFLPCITEKETAKACFQQDDTTCHTANVMTTCTFSPLFGDLIIWEGLWSPWLAGFVTTKIVFAILRTMPITIIHAMWVTWKPTGLTCHPLCRRRCLQHA